MTDEALHCNSCNLDFKNNTCYKKHLKTSRHIQRSTNANIIVFSCICGRSYSYHQSLYVHRKKCEIYKNNICSSQVCDSVTNEKIMSYEKELSELKSQG